MANMQVKMVKVIRDSSNFKLDYEIPATRARELYNQGKLGFDTVNKQYCTIGSNPMLIVK